LVIIWFSGMDPEKKCTLLSDFGRVYQIPLVNIHFIKVNVFLVGIIHKTTNFNFTFLTAGSQ